LFALRPILANQGSVFLLALDASGNLVAAQGDIKALDVSGNFIDAPQLPTLSLSYTPFAYYVVKVGATGSAWTFGTSNNSGATGVTYAFVDVLSLPARPVVS
jgi:hypothetical protein